MRDRIARHAPPKSPWDFKHLPGGLFDIDFVAQYLALRHAAERPDLLDPHPAEMLRRAADAGVIDRTDAERLRAARTLLSDVQGLLRLTLNGDEAAFDEARRARRPAPSHRRHRRRRRSRRVAGAHRG